MARSSGLFLFICIHEARFPFLDLFRLFKELGDNGEHGVGWSGALSILGLGLFPHRLLVGPH